MEDAVQSRVDVFLVKSLLAAAAMARHKGWLVQSKAADHQAYVRARRMHDVHLSACAQLGLAQAIAATSLGPKPSALATAALAAFEEAGDSTRAAQALQLCSYLAVAQGRVREGLDAACRAYALAEVGNNEQELAWAANYRGLACYWAGAKQEGLDLLEASAWLLPVTEVQPLLNFCFVRMLPAMAGDTAATDAQDWGVINQFLGQVEARLTEVDAAPRAAGGLPQLHAILRCLQSRARVAVGDRVRAEAAYGQAQTALRLLPRSSWVQGLRPWTRAAFAASEPEATTQLKALGRLSARGGHYGMATVGSILAGEQPNGGRLALI